MAAKLRKVPHKIWLNGKVKCFSNSVIFKGVEMKFDIETNFGPLNLENNTKVEFPSE